MNNELKYHGKSLNEMSDNELNQQYVINKQRTIRNDAFLAFVSGARLYYCPPVAVIPLGIETFRLY